MKNSAYRVAALIAFLIITAQPGFAGKDPEARLKQKADRIHRSVLTLDSHNDTPMWLADTTYNFAEDHRGKRPRNRVDIPGMRTGGLDGAFFAVFTSQGERTGEGNLHAMKEALKLFEAIGKTVDRHSGSLEMATTSREAYTINKRGKLAVFIGVENGYPIGNDLKNVEKFYNLGARYITLCHTRNNDLCDSSTDTTEHQGVSPFGYKVIEEMNRHGMMVDVSHVSDKSFYDAIKASKTPVIASHSCARAICNNPRNLDDAMLNALAADGGVIQMCILSSYVKTPVPYPQRDSAQAALRLKYRGFKGLSDEEMNQARKEWYAIEDTYPQELATVSDVVDHIDHIVSVAGIRHVGIGTDFDGGGAVKGCEYASEMGNITLELLRRGYSARQIRMIWSGNLLRVMREVEAYASATK
jgi:membrane dipeptidase